MVHGEKGPVLSGDVGHSPYARADHAGVAPGLASQGRCDEAGSGESAIRPSVGYAFKGILLCLHLMVESLSGGLRRIKREDHRALFAQRSERILGREIKRAHSIP